MYFYSVAFDLFIHLAGLELVRKAAIWHLWPTFWNLAGWCFRAYCNSWKHLAGLSGPRSAPPREKPRWPPNHTIAFIIHQSTCLIVCKFVILALKSHYLIFKHISISIWPLFYEMWAFFWRPLLRKPRIVITSLFVLRLLWNWWLYIGFHGQGF